jgi:hypothetical protein
MSRYVVWLILRGCLETKPLYEQYFGHFLAKGVNK